ncbi:hypothetical protein SBOR_1398 [Sclerotinia borealis F-4128]|uniref:SCP domain-containing protein n=1 Tax=Sclerotinia borealis (strain F-4128) TaxID=1432307 RepID=W9CN47_SCLBF|nr:hypothetical protein SBOR_1398 [Sclerotinia borealis F-4128]
MYLSVLISVLLTFGYAIATPQLDANALSSLSLEATSSTIVETLMPDTMIAQSTGSSSALLIPLPLLSIESAFMESANSTKTNSATTTTTATTAITTETMFTVSLTETLHSLSENDSRAATSTTSTLTSVQTSVPALATQALTGEIGFSTPEQFKTQILLAHNWYRAAHGADPLIWNDTLANSSTTWVAECVWGTESTPDIGKIYVSTIPTTSVFGIMNDLGLERQFYNWSDPGPDNSTKQFTQMVWKSTTQLGCAWNNCPPGSSPDTEPPVSTEVSLFLLCQYYPKGNVGNSTDWKNNVGELISGNLGQGVAAATDLGLTTATTSTTSRSPAATGVVRKSLGNKLEYSLFAMILTAVVLIGSVTISPSVLVPVLLLFGAADATPEQDNEASSSLLAHGWISATAAPIRTGNVQVVSKEFNTQAIQLRLVLAHHHIPQL